MGAYRRRPSTGEPDEPGLLPVMGPRKAVSPERSERPQGAKSSSRPATAGVARKGCYRAFIPKEALCNLGMLKGTSASSSMSFVEAGTQWKAASTPAELFQGHTV